MLPAINYAGLLNPISSLEGAGRMIGEGNPTTYMLLISRGVFGKGLGFSDLAQHFLPLLVCAPLILAASILLLKKQNR
jgi:ribosome-dependent ATPase